jgi:hypothetical protein
LGGFSAEPVEYPSNKLDSTGQEPDIFNAFHDGVEAWKRSARGSLNNRKKASSGESLTEYNKTIKGKSKR